MQNPKVISTLNYTSDRWSIDILCLTLLLFIFYTLWLGNYPVFTPDEGRYSEVAREMVASGDYTTPRVNGVAFLDKPILYYWFQAIAIKLFGVKEWALRLFPALFGVLGSLIVYICGRRLFNRRTGLVAAIVLATSPLYFGCSHYANLDLEVAVFISSTLLCFITGLKLTDKSRTYFLLSAYIFAALAFLTKGLIGIVFPLTIIGAWILIANAYKNLKPLYLISGILVFLALILPWYIMVQKANPKFLEYFFVTQQITRFLSSAEFNNKTPLWFYIPVILVGFFPWTIFLVQSIKNVAQKTWHIRQQQGAELFLLIWIITIFIFFSIPQSKTLGYILPIFPALALLVAHYLDENWETAPYWGTLCFIVLGAALAMALWLVNYTQYIHIPSGFSTYLHAIVIFIIASALVAILFIKSKTSFPLFAILVGSSVLSLGTLTYSASYLNHNTLKPLVLYLKTIIRPEDEVIHYFRFYQDVPLYLGKRVTIVADWNARNITSKDNWMRELWYGMKFQKTNEWLINDKDFWQRWHSDKRVFVFMHINYFVEFQPKVTRYFHLGKHNDVVLLSNKPTIEARNQRKTQNLLEANVKADSTTRT